MIVRSRRNNDVQRINIKTFLFRKQVTLSTSMLSTAIIMTMMIGCSLHHFQRDSFVVSAKRISTAAYAHRYYTKGQRNVAAFTTRSAASTCVNSSYNSGSNIGSNFGLGIVSSSSPSAFTSSIRDKNTIILETNNGYQPRGFHRLFLSSTTIETSSSDSSDNQEQSGEEKKSSSNYITTKNQGEKFHGKIEQESNSIKYPKGIPDGFYIIQHYAIPDGDTFNDMLQNAIKVTAAADDDTDASKNENDGIIGKPSGVTQEELDRLGIANGENVTLPIALMLLDPEEYPSFSKARKACRKGYIIIHRGPLNGNTNDVMEENNSEEADIEQLVEMEEEEYDDDDEGQNSNENLFDLTKCIRGRVADRVYPNDVIGRQVRMHGGFYPGLDCKKPPFDLPVVYEDDHFAIVNKPAGVVVYAQRNQGHGMMTIRSALPFALKPPKRGTLAIIRRPVSVHRLDKPTSGCLLIAKTKPAMVDLSRQFVERRIKKTYTAIVNGIPDEPTSSSITMEDAHKMGVDVGYSTSLPTEAKEEKWQLIDFALDDGNSVKSAVTVWKPLEYVKSLKANDGTLTKVEMKPKTGRYHQLRRHMAWVKESPIVGDKEYDGGKEAMDLRGRGLFLCSNKVVLEHPYYNTEVGRKEWENLEDNEKWRDGMIKLSDDSSGNSIVQVNVSIDLPGKFTSFLKTEGERADKFGNDNKIDS